jgi:hypothetical protein
VAAHVEAAGAPLVLVGDDRQLGPGGALGALLARHPGAVHTLGENRRQLDAEEREVLAELRAGNVDKAVSWFMAEQRVHAVPERDKALQAAVDAWPPVALAPSREGTLVTSQRATVERVDLAQGTVTIRTTDAQQVNLGAEEAEADRLGYAYATTVHRSQGATTARAHLFADGGGRELAYVAMSRAREATHVWTVADDLGQAREDLVRDWSTARRPTWAIDTGLPEGGQLGRTNLGALSAADRARVAALANAQLRLVAGAARDERPSDDTPRLDEAAAALVRLRQDRADLEAGGGRYVRTEAGAAVRGLREARAELRSAEQAAPAARSWKERHGASRRVPVLAGRASEAQRRWDALVVPELAYLEAEVARQEATVQQLSEAVQRRRARSEEGTRRRADLGHTSSLLDGVLGAYRDEIDGVAQPRTPTPAHAAFAPLRPSHAYGPVADADSGPSL